MGKHQAPVLQQWLVIIFSVMLTFAGYVRSQ